MLWVAMLAYSNAPLVSVQYESVEERRHRLFAGFVETMLQRKRRERRYSCEQTTAWISYLARTLTAKRQTFFYLENLDLDWPPTQVYRLLALVEIILVSLPAFWLIGAQSYGLIGGLAFGLIFGLIFGQLELRPVEKFQIHVKAKLIGGLICGLICGLIGGLIFGLRDGVIEGLKDGLMFGLVGLIYRLAFNAEAVAETRIQPDQGTQRSIKMALIIGPIIGLISGLNLGLIDGLCTGLYGGLTCGGVFAIRNFGLRLALWQSGSAPLRYVKFLNEAKDLLFLRQVGGGYIFTHRLLRDYFASLPQSKHQPKQRSKAATAS